MPNYFTPPSNNNKRGKPQSASYPDQGGSYAQSPPPIKQGGYIPPPAGAKHTSGQTVLHCPRCHERLPFGMDHATHLLGCGAAELFTNAFTPYQYPYPPRPNHPGRR